MAWAEKKTFVKYAAVRRGIRRRRKNRVSQTKGSGHDIFLNKCDEKLTKVRVCRLFFLNTLSLGEDSFKRWTKESDTLPESVSSGDETPACNTANHLASSIPVRPESKQTRLKKIVKTLIDLIPKVPSHYCRASSNKLYVESTFRSENTCTRFLLNAVENKTIKQLADLLFLKK